LQVLAFSRSESGLLAWGAIPQREKR